jgi:hypothetical protein
MNGVRVFAGVQALRLPERPQPPSTPDHAMNKVRDWPPDAVERFTVTATKSA